MERRIRRIGIFLVLCFGALFIQLNNIQVLRANSLATDSDNPRVIAANNDQPRGSILSADGVTLAISTPVPKFGYQRVYNPATAQWLAHITGFDSPDFGLTGVELEYDNYLKSHTRQARSLRDLLVNRTVTDNVTLTISAKLQTEVAQIMDSYSKVDGAPVSAAVVIDPKTGAILAMYSNPTFDPNYLASPDGKIETYYYDSLDYKSGESPLVSAAFQRSFIPGSTFKAVTSSAVYDHDPSLAAVDYPLKDCITVTGRVQRVCNYETSPGVHESCGGTIQTTLPASCNTAFAQMGLALVTNLSAEADAFGFNQHLPLDIPGSGVSAFPSAAVLSVNQPVLATAAFGQGAGTNTVSATPLQMALVAAGVADNGVIMTPHVMANIRDSDGNLVETYQPKPWRQASSAATAAQVTQLMQGVVSQPFGTAYTVGFPASWNVAAKTGTAETGTNPQGNSQTNDWMIAFAPANDPKVAVAVAIPNQPASATGATVSGPPTKAILGAALGLTS